jgi:hypothetical protein
VANDDVGVNGIGNTASRDGDGAALIHRRRNPPSVTGHTKLVRDTDTVKMGKDDKNITDQIPHLRKEPRPDFSAPIKSEKLPPKLQKIVDRESSVWDELYEGE